MPSGAHALAPAAAAPLPPLPLLLLLLLLLYTKVEEGTRGHSRVLGAPPATSSALTLARRRAARKRRAERCKLSTREALPKRSRRANMGAAAAARKAAREAAAALAERSALGCAGVRE